MTTNSTSPSLLARAQGGEDDAWKRLYEIYRPWLASILMHRGNIPKSDIEHVVQDVLGGLLESLSKFERRRTGSFRAWLKKIACTQVALWWRQKTVNPAGGSENLAAIEQVTDPVNPLAEAIEAEHDAAVVHGCLRQAKSHSNLPQNYIDMFRMYKVEGKAVEEVVSKLGGNTDLVHKAASLVKAYIKENCCDLLD